MPATYDDKQMKKRLREAVEAKGKALGAVSEAAGFSYGYLAGVLNSDRDPHLGKIIKICENVPVSPIYVIYGYEVPEGGDEILQMIAANPELTPAIVDLLRARLPSADQQ